MLPQSLWLLVLSYLSSIEARSSPQLRGVAFSNGTFTNASLSVVSSSIGSVSSAVPISTQTATATSISTSDTGKSTNSSIASQISASKILKSSAPTESPKTTRTLRNETVQTHAPCCFVIQDTISEEWWQRTSYISATNLVNLTSYTTYITERPGITATRVETNVYLTNASFAFTFLVGKDPISNLINSAPTPVEATQVLNATQIVTGGITMQSPSAFYVYNTVKIITAAPVTDARGHVYCATASTGAHGDVFRHINSNAEAYFGGLGIVGQSYAPISTSVTTETDTYTELYPITSVVTETNTWSEVFVSTQYTNSAGSVVVETSTPTGVVISLVTPFIYAPKRGTTTPGPFAHCIQDADTEAYGYVPKTLIDFLASDPQYSSQYPGLESCYGGGPSIIQAPMCYVPFETTTFQTAGGDITSATTIYW
ncbi:uncharacterized protein LY89DRAFT_229739 [Mollisia scopiformis]|uniref:Uncharacterized protein n=1 Tax=Mollisia scopiformis TaxID=149040 RepID=A0A194WVI9_MOLSC|nr:uncharacterized protein LY89DRAFT_229739 [Mollisia scopiformis]KUJ11684.1 hypothetical protein LY89DRAFT_229739 [Mollisia scopiformis]